MISARVVRLGHRRGWRRTRLALLVVTLVVLVEALAGLVVARAEVRRQIFLEGNGLGVVSFGASASRTTAILRAELGAPTGHPAAGCAGSYRESAWNDLIVQFKGGRFTGYRYLAGGIAGVTPTTSTIRAVSPPRLETKDGIMLGDTFSSLRRADPTIRQSGTEFWRTRGGVVFGFAAPPRVGARSPIYEIKVGACPGAL